MNFFSVKFCVVFLLTLIVAMTAMACSSPPPLELTASASVGQIPLTITFTPSETDFDELRWDFGDGETLISRPDEGPVSHTFTTIGTHTVTVATLNRDSNKIGESASVTVNAIAGILDNFSLSPDSLTVLPEGAGSFNVSAFDQFGNPLPDAMASYSVSDSAGSIDEQGNFTAGQNAGTHTDSLNVEVTLEGVTLNTRTTIVIRPGPLSQIILTPRNILTTPLGQIAFSTLAVDEFGNPLSNIQKTFKADIAAGQIDDSGAFTAGTRAGAWVSAVLVEATDGTNTVSAQARVRIKPGPLAQFFLLPDTPRVQAGGQVGFTASALDEWGNVLTGLNIQYDENSNAGSISPRGDFVAAGLAGVFRDAVKVQALAGGVTLSASTDVIVTPGPLDHVLIAPAAAEVRASETVSFTARASDVFGNEIEGARVTWEVSGNTGTIDDQGALTAGTQAGFYPGSVVASARFDGASVDRSASVRVIPGPLSFATASPGLIKLGTGEIVQLEPPRAFDRHGNAIEVAIVIWSMVDSEAGEVSPSGLFAASETAGKRPDALQARISKEGATRVITVSVTILPVP